MKLVGVVDREVRVVDEGQAVDRGSQRGEGGDEVVEWRVLHLLGKWAVGLAVAGRAAVGLEEADVGDVARLVGSFADRRRQAVGGGEREVGEDDGDEGGEAAHG